MAGATYVTSPLSSRPSSPSISMTTGCFSETSGRSVSGTSSSAHMLETSTTSNSVSSTPTSLPTVALRRVTMPASGVVSV